MHYLHEGDSSDTSDLTQTRHKLYHQLLQNSESQIVKFGASLVVHLCFCLHTVWLLVLNTSTNAFEDRNTAYYNKQLLLTKTMVCSLNSCYLPLTQVLLTPM